MIETLQLLQDCLANVEKQLAVTVFHKSGRLLLSDPIKSARKKVSKVLSRIEFLAALKDKEGLTREQIQKLARARGLKQSDGFSVKLAKG